MKRWIICILAFLMLCVPSAACAEGWDQSVPTEITEEVQALFDKAMEGLVGVNYTPVAVLGKNGSTLCVLCKATVVYPGAEPYNVLVYVNENGIQNIYELWIDKHAERKEISEETPGAPG